MRTICVTGGAGFIGSHFIRMMLAKYPDYRLINIDALTYAGNIENTKDFAKNANYQFFKADIRDKKHMQEIFRCSQVTAVVNFAAETHVDRSIDDPDSFVTTNIVGTQILLDTARKYWQENTNDRYAKGFRTDVKFLQVSTDEVYGSLGSTGFFDETMPLLPNSPYAASKASADMLVRAYSKTFGLPVNITRCSNNFGPCQFPEKLIPRMIIHCLQGQELPVYGDGKHVRDWIYVTDHCQAIDKVLHYGEKGAIYNISGNNEKTNLDIVRQVVELLGKPECLIRHVEDRPGHDRRYAVDSARIKRELGWEPVYSFEQGLKETVQWYLDHRDWLDAIDYAR